RMLGLEMARGGLNVIKMPHSPPILRSTQRLLARYFLQHCNNEPELSCPEPTAYRTGGHAIRPDSAAGARGLCWLSAAAEWISTASAGPVASATAAEWISTASAGPVASAAAAERISTASAGPVASAAAAEWISTASAGPVASAATAGRPVASESTAARSVASGSAAAGSVASGSAAASAGSMASGSAAAGPAAASAGSVASGSAAAPAAAARPMASGPPTAPAAASFRWPCWSASFWSAGLWAAAAANGRFGASGTKRAAPGDGTVRLSILGQHSFQPIRLPTDQLQSRLPAYQSLESRLAGLR
ncbi:hypothetical protein BOX15_Mlig025433g1, partial [Macrostomum lignano]